MSSKEVDSPHYLFRLCGYEKWDGVREYLNRSDQSTDVKKKQIYWKGSLGWTTFNVACFKKGPIDIIKSMIAIAGDEIVHVATDKNETNLHHACYKGVAVEIMKLLIQIGKKKLVMEKSSKNITALHYACWINVINVGDIKPMVDIGGKELVLEADNKWKITCLHKACMSKPTPDALKLLLNVGGKDLLMSQNKNGSTPFHIALERPNNHGPQGLQVFVYAGDMEVFVAKNNQGQTPISLIKDLKSSEEFTSQEWKDFFCYFDKKLSKEGVVMAKTETGVEDENENEKTITSLQNDIKMLEDKKKSDAKVIKSLETRLEKQEKEDEERKNAIQVLQKENGESKETIQSLQAEKENHAEIITSLRMEKESDTNLIEAIKAENEKAKAIIQSLQAEKEIHGETIESLQTEKEEICIEKQGIIMKHEAKIASEHEKDKTIQSLHEEITYLQLELDEAREEGAGKMRVMKRKIEKLEKSSKEESHGVKKKRSRLFFW